MRTTRTDPAERARRRLARLSAAHGLDAARARLDDVASIAGEGLAAVEASLGALTGGRTVAAAAARHLVAAGGKRIRPTICLLAAAAVAGGDRADAGVTPGPRELREATRRDDAVDPSRRSRDSDRPLAEGSGVGREGRRGRPDPRGAAGRGRGGERAPRLSAGERVRLVATVAEAVHGATLLHDDVVDLGEVRRGAPTARAVFGNAASVLAGDLLLVRALALVEQAGLPGLAESVLDVLARMIDAEALQLERRGSAATTRDDYLAIVLGKTASLFEWAAAAGARAVLPAEAGAADPRALALAGYGREVGVAFQVVDDVLDLTGDAGTFGKGLLADVREGKVTYPLIHALGADPGLAAPLEAAARGETCDLEALGRRVRVAAEASGGIAAARVEVHDRTERAVAALDVLGPSPARDALTAVARAMAERTR